MKNILLQNYTQYLKGAVNKSEGTITQYTSDLNLWFNYMKDNHFAVTKETIRKVDLSHIHNFLFYITEKGNSALTRRRKISTLKSFFSYLKSVKLVKENIMLEVEKPQIDKTIPRYFELEECIKLIDAANTNSRNPERDSLIIKLFLSTGMRLSELVSLNVENVQKNTLIIKGKGNKERVAYLSKSIMDQLKEFTKDKDMSSPLFVSERGNRLDKSSIQSVIRNAIEKSELNKNGQGHVLVHTLRHTFASLNYQSGVDIRALQTMMGHKDISTTQIYTHIADNKLSEIAENSPINSII